MKWMMLAVVVAGVSLGLITACGGDGEVTRLYDDDGTLIVEFETRSYEDDVQPVVQNICIACHFSFVPAFVLTGNAQTDYAAVSQRIETNAPLDSLLIRKPSGQTSHGGGTVLPVGSEEYDIVVEWISGGGSE